MASSAYAEECRRPLFLSICFSVSVMINPAFMHRQEEAALLGAMVIGYGELDVSFSHIAGLAINHKYAVLEACHSVRSEEGRLKIAKALAADAFNERGLRREYAITERGMRFCLKIRNQFAHAQWGDFPDGLKFTNPESAFSRPLKPIEWKLITLDLLRAQEAFFENTRMWLIYLEMVVASRVKNQIPYLNKPPEMNLPNPHNPQPTPGRTPKGKGSHSQPQ